MTITTDTPTAPVESAAIEEFAGRMLGVFNDSALCLLLSVGHQTGLFDTMATLSPSTSVEIAAAAGLHERYVREWLDGVTAGRVVEHDPARSTYWLPAEHAACLTTAAGPGNFARMMQLVPLLAQVESDVVRCFTEGGGVGYEGFPRFHALMNEDSTATHDAGLIDAVVPAVPGLHDRLTAGAAVADVGCGSGHAVNLLARAYPASRFVGFDFAAEAIDAARAEAVAWGLDNAEFVVRDIAELGVSEEYDVVTAFDAIHDQAHPARVLAQVATALKPGGTFLMVDIKASSHVHENIDQPGSTFLYTVSLMHCMTVSLAQGGDGLGTAWGRQTAERMLAEAGFNHVEVREVAHDMFNSYYVATRS
ncbi:class I SAM-dependent methyltransferase [Nocardioides humilatus]|uniref:Class I SAM-dependent methyltransferase n=1 Tax=Nocardioides humilatus TaxID=2607660 RepID=A0A5B1LDS1_9ACTN|nr:methyltransferase domain-containing protein [Nocardioides humilatus]KAA1418444.1 class I SAM-dependent methyltransferase [Nocardioides humilatus]